MDGQNDSMGKDFGGADLPIAEEFLRRLRDVPPSRLVTAVGTTAHGLHRLLAELRPDPTELRAVISLLTEIGHASDQRRQEWVLLADVLGLSSQVEAQCNPRPPGVTPNTVLGPFYRADAPDLPLGANISRDGKGQPLAVSGRVAMLGGCPASGAIIEVWHANAQGRYENQEPDLQPENNLRGRFRADADGQFHFRSVMPAGYALPSDGPVGRLMAALGLCLERPAHLQFRVLAKGAQVLTTHVFDRADPAIGRDAIFGVTPELMAEFRHLPDQGRVLELELVLCPKAQTETREETT